MAMRIACLVVVCFLWLPVRVAEASVFCGFAGDSILVTLTDGDDVVVEATPSGVVLNGTLTCGEPDEYESLEIVGGAGPDSVTLKGSFAPGRSFESDFDELEVIVSLGGGSDTVAVELTEGTDEITGSSNTLWLNVDSDADMTFDAENVHIYALDGVDTLNFDTWSLGRLYLHGGRGNDQLYGSAGIDRLYGDEDSDILDGNGGNDFLYDGPGADGVEGGTGNDRFEQDSEPDVGDRFFGGAGVDTVNYGARTGVLSVNLADGLPLDGQAGEGDLVMDDVERVIGGSGDDTLVGSAVANVLSGGDGHDSLFGGGGGDTLNGGNGDDHLAGETGGDKLFGDAGDDTLEGASGNDTLRGGDDSDVLDGGVGTDVYFGEAGDDFLYNADNAAETVDCGAGTDDPEPDGLDTFVACENI